MVSFLLATIYKQAISPIIFSYSAIFPLGAFILPVISCYSVLVTSSSLSSLSPGGPHPAPPLVYPVHQTTFPSRSFFSALNCHTCYFSLSSMSFSSTCRPASQIDMQFWVRACALCRILNSKAQPDTPSLTESVYLRVPNIPNAAGGCGSLHLIPHSHLIVLQAAALRWQSGNYIFQSVIPTCTLKLIHLDNISWLPLRLPFVLRLFLFNPHTASMSIGGMDDFVVGFLL